jgi:hypothetical protein
MVPDLGGRFWLSYGVDGSVVTDNDAWEKRLRRRRVAGMNWWAFKGHQLRQCPRDLKHNVRTSGILRWRRKEDIEAALDKRRRGETAEN